MERETKKESKSRKPIIKGSGLVSSAFARFFQRFFFWKKNASPKGEDIKMTKTKSASSKNESAQTNESRMGCKVTINSKQPKPGPSQSAPPTASQDPKTKLSGADLDAINEAPELEDDIGEGQEY
jgi:hypothetical protein